MSHRNNFGLIRLLAALQVLTYHSMAHLHASLTVPWLSALLGFFPGVPIFFVISGFLISASWEHAPDWKRYALRRALRIFPALWVCLVVTALLLISVGHLKLPIWWIGIQSLGIDYTPAALRGWGVGNPNGSLWTIPVELSFYMTLPLVYLVGIRTARMIDVLFIFLSILSLAAAIHPIFGRQGQTLVPYFWEFGLGVLAQRHWVIFKRCLEGYGAWWLIGFLGIAWAISGTHYAWIATCALLAPVTLSLAYTKVMLSDRLLRGIDASYGTYLYHMVWVNLAIHFRFMGPGLPVAAVFTATGLSAVLSWFLIEKKALAVRVPNKKIAVTID